MKDPTLLAFIEAIFRHKYSMTALWVTAAFQFAAAPCFVGRRDGGGRRTQGGSVFPRSGI